MAADCIRLRGTVSSARHYLDTAGTSWLHLVLAQPSQHGGLPAVVARRRLGNGPAAQMATASLAKQLRSGDTVVAWGDALGVCPHSGHFLLLGCTHFERLDPEPPGTQADRSNTQEHAA